MPRPNRDKEIIRALRANPDPKAVAAEQGITTRTVYNAVKRSGVDLDLLRKIHELPAHQEHLAYRYLAERGIPKTDIARKFGVSVQYISQVA